MLYYTFTKRWFTDAMNFADLPSLNEADTKVEVEGQFLHGRFPFFHSAGGCPTMRSEIYVCDIHEATVTATFSTKTL